MISYLIHFDNKLNYQFTATSPWDWANDDTRVTSLAELNAQTSTSFYFDQAKGWVHVKLVEEGDRTTGGFFEDRSTGEPVTTECTGQVQKNSFATNKELDEK